jgi:hypothetical protein
MPQGEKATTKRGAKRQASQTLAFPDESAKSLSSLPEPSAEAPRKKPRARVSDSLDVSTTDHRKALRQMNVSPSVGRSVKHDSKGEGDMLIGRGGQNRSTSGVTNQNPVSRTSSRRQMLCPHRHLLLHLLRSVHTKSYRLLKPV